MDGSTLGQRVENTVVVHSFGNDPNHEKLTPHAFPQGNAGFAQKIGQQDARVGLVRLAMSVEDGDLFMGQSSQLIWAKVQRFALVGLDGQVSGRGRRRGVFHLLGNKRELSGEERESERRNGKSRRSTHHSAILEQSSFHGMKVSGSACNLLIGWTSQYVV